MVESIQFNAIFRKLCTFFIIQFQQLFVIGYPHQVSNTSHTTTHSKNVYFSCSSTKFSGFTIHFFALDIDWQVYESQRMLDVNQQNMNDN